MALALAAYAVLGLAALWPDLPGQTSRLTQCVCGDPVLSTWFLEWVPSSLIHGHNPLFTAALNAPSGVNLAQNTSMPLLGVLLSPLTLTAGPVVSYNLLLYLAFPLSAGAMFFALLQWTDAALPAFLGGLLYGFSTFTIGQGADHPMLSFVPLLPLILLLVYDIVIRQRGSPYREGIALGLLVVAQFFIEPELLADMALLVGCGLLIVVVVHRAEVVRAAGYAARGLGCGAVLAAVVLAYPIWFMFLGREHFSGTVQPTSNPYRSDLLGPLVPTTLQRLSPAFLSELAQKITHSGAVQNDSYVGLPLLVTAMLLLLWFRRDRWMILAAVVAAIAFLLSLGPRLVVGGTHTSMILPFDLITHVPVLDSTLPVRFSLFEEMFLSIVVALGVARLLARPASEKVRRATIARLHSRSPAVQTSPIAVGPRWAASLAVVGALVLVPLVPRWPYPSARVHLPHFFTSSEVESILAGSTVLAYPLPLYPYDQAMLWQAEASMRFRLVGGYALQRGRAGTAALDSVPLTPIDVEQYLRALEVDAGALPPMAQPIGRQLSQDVQRFVRAHQVSTVIVDPAFDHSTAAIALFTAALGAPRSEGGVDLWPNLSPVGSAGSPEH